MNVIRHHNIDNLIDALSEEIALKLQSAIQQNHIAKLLVSGGKSPIPLFEKLSQKDISWKNVVIGLVDERFVDVQNESSNEKLVMDHLLKNYAKDASFVGLIYNLDSMEKNLEVAQNLYRTFHSGIDVCILGMGTDGHTASLFPNDPSSQRNLHEIDQSLLVNTVSPIPPNQRISCSKYLIDHSKNIYLMISGSEKLEVLNRAEMDELPIAHFFHTSRTNLIIHYNEN